MRHWSQFRRSFTALAVAAGTMAVAGAASAQSPFGRPTPAGPVGPADPFFGGFNPGFPFNPAFPPNGNGFPSNFAPGSQFANPFTQGLLGANAFANQLTNPFLNTGTLGTFDSGFVNGFNGLNTLNGFPGFVEPGLLGGTALVNPFQPVGTPFGSFGGYGALPNGASAMPPPPGAMMAARLPLLGINTSVRTVGGLPPNLFANRRIGGGASARTRTARAQTNTTARRDANADLEARSATRMAQIMQSRPMVAGHVSRVSLNTIQVKLDSRRSATRSYSPSEVFFYRNDQLLDAATAPGKLRKGEAVLVPDASNQPS
jgi:hypothetical protein